MTLTPLEQMKLIDQNDQLRADLAEREAEIAKLREALIGWFEEEISDLQLDEFAASLSTPPSASYLEQWEKDRYGEPVAYINVNDRKLDYAMNTVFHTPTTIDIPPIPLYAQKD